MRGSKRTKAARKAVLVLLATLPCWLLTSPVQAVPSCSDCQNRLNTCLLNCDVTCGSDTNCQDSCDLGCANDPLTKSCFSHCRNPLAVASVAPTSCSSKVAPEGFRAFLAR